MIHKIKLLIASLVLPIILIAPVTVHAYDPFSKACDGSSEAQTSSLCQEKTNAVENPVYGPNGIINKVANIIAIVAGLAAIIFIMISGLKLITSSGDSQKLTEARNAIVYSAVGLVVIALARVMVGFIMRLV